MIIGYYHQSIFGGATYFKLTKKDNEEQYKFEYCHQVVPNYIPNACDYIKKYDTLIIEEKRLQEYFQGKIVKIDLVYNVEIKNIVDILNNANWDIIYKHEYTSENLDDVHWKFYIEDGLDKVIFIDGYSVYPKEIDEIYNIFEKMKEKYIGEVEPNKKDLENILRNKESNLSFIKYMAKKGRLGYKKEDIKIQKEKYKNYEKKLKEIYRKEENGNEKVKIRK